MSDGSKRCNLARPLQAYRIGEEEIYAAYDVAGALALANQEYGETFFGLADVKACDQATLESPAFAAVEGSFGSLGQLLASMSGPGYLCTCRR